MKLCWDRNRWRLKMMEHRQAETKNENGGIRLMKIFWQKTREIAELPLFGVCTPALWWHIEILTIWIMSWQREVETTDYREGKLQHIRSTQESLVTVQNLLHPLVPSIFFGSKIKLLFHQTRKAYYHIITVTLTKSDLAAFGTVHLNKLTHRSLLFWVCSTLLVMFLYNVMREKMAAYTKDRNEIVKIERNGR